MKKIEKTIGRDISLLDIYAWHISYTTGMMKNLGWSYSDTIFYVHDGATEIMRPPQEHLVDFKEVIISKIKSNSRWFEFECQKVIEQTEELELFFDQNSDLSNLKSIELWNQYQKYCDLIEIYTSRFITVFWFPVWAESDTSMSEEFAKEIFACIDVRKRIEKIFPKGDVFINRLLEKLNEDWKFEKSLLRVISRQEFFDFVNKNIVPQESILRERQKGFVYSRLGINLVDNQPVSLKNIIAEIGYDYEVDNVDYKTITQLKGSSACRGIVTGRVRVILSKSKISEVKEGEVLVASMTTPEYLPAMQKASAFITDEGGITCHAAIVARELKKPCIIGTKIATKVLRDGDMVEVDADKGIVNIIK